MGIKKTSRKSVEKMGWNSLYNSEFLLNEKGQGVRRGEGGFWRKLTGIVVDVNWAKRIRRGRARSISNDSEPGHNFPLDRRR